ncbi:hypothetical protein ACOMHN_059903 [Nucella lapillus]
MGKLRGSPLKRKRNKAENSWKKSKTAKRKRGKLMCTICSANDYRTFTAVASLVNHIKSKHLGAHEEAHRGKPIPLQRVL